MALIQRIGLWHLIIYLIGIDCTSKVGGNKKGNGNIESNNNNNNISRNYGNNDLMIRGCMFSFSSILLLLFVAVVVLFLVVFLVLFFYIVILFCLFVVFGWYFKTFLQY